MWAAMREEASQRTWKTWSGNHPHQSGSRVNTGLAVITVGDHDNTIVVVAGANDKVDREYVDSIGDALLACDIVVLLQHEIPQDTISM